MVISQFPMIIFSKESGVLYENQILRVAPK